MDAISRLCQEADLDAAGRQALEKLEADEVAQLAGIFAEARERQARELDAAIDNGLRMVPRLVRPAVSKILFAGTTEDRTPADTSQLPTAHARTDAEIVKLTRDLGVDEDALAYLGALPGGEVMRLRHQLVDRMERDQRPTFGRIALASSLLPTGLTVQIAVRFFGPMLCGRVAPELAPDRASKLVNRFPLDFLVASSPYMNPARSVEIVRSLPFDTLLAVTRGLLAADDHITLGRYVAVLETGTLVDLVRATYDPEDLFLLWLYAEHPSALGPVFAALAAEQLAAVREVAEERGELDLVGALPDGA